MIYNKTKFENDKIYIIGFLKIIKINDIEEIKRALKSKRFSLIINFNNNSKIDYSKIRIKLTQKFKVKSLSLSLLLLLSLSLFEKCFQIFKISKI